MRILPFLAFAYPQRIHTHGRTDVHVEADALEEEEALPFTTLLANARNTGMGTNPGRFCRFLHLIPDGCLAQTVAIPLIVSLANKVVKERPSPGAGHRPVSAAKNTTLVGFRISMD